ncbi:MAG: hypothetical protein CM15mV127_040 [Caudoviricetes sp.]|nr:MAG: hypothetical protein CM15mV127_040 [Caudoviricetes sp.]
MRFFKMFWGMGKKRNNLLAQRILDSEETTSDKVFYPRH